MAIETFMVELTNPHTRRRMERSYCSVEGCRRKHETTDSGARRHTVAQPWTDDVWDLRRVDTGEVVERDVWGLTLCSIPGAMFFVDIEDKAADRREPGAHTFGSGPQLHAILPDKHPWNIDGRASNCTMKDDFDHRCWIRHGDPPRITVDKNGHTCAAGAGSIQGPEYHGFLTDGHFT